tara:strand:+ start:880 stop:1173 length:294 start_codon:yes stop_codon:yes gene_type:complete
LIGRWDQDKRPDIELLANFRNLQLRLLHYKDRKKNVLGKSEIEKIDSKIRDLYLELREIYERSDNRILELIYQDKAEGFETFAWFLMLSEETQKRFR